MRRIIEGVDNHSAFDNYDGHFRDREPQRLRSKRRISKRRQNEKLRGGSIMLGIAS
jgi:hypothetical protein